MTDQIREQLEAILQEPLQDPFEDDELTPEEVTPLLSRLPMPEPSPEFAAFIADLSYEDLIRLSYGEDLSRRPSEASTEIIEPVAEQSTPVIDILHLWRRQAVERRREQDRGDVGEPHPGVVGLAVTMVIPVAVILLVRWAPWR